MLTEEFTGVGTCTVTACDNSGDIVSTTKLTTSCAKITLKVTHKYDYTTVMYTVTNIIPTMTLHWISPTCMKGSSQHTMSLCILQGTCSSWNVGKTHKFVTGKSESVLVEYYGMSVILIKYMQMLLL